MHFPIDEETTILKRKKPKIALQIDRSLCLCLRMYNIVSAKITSGCNCRCVLSALVHILRWFVSVSARLTLLAVAYLSCNVCVLEFSHIVSRSASVVKVRSLSIPFFCATSVVLFCLISVLFRLWTLVVLLRSSAITLICFIWIEVFCSTLFVPFHLSLDVLFCISYLFLSLHMRQSAGLRMQKRAAFCS